MAMWRFAVYAVVLLAAGWMAWATMAPEEPTVAERISGIPVIVFVTSTNEVRVGAPGAGGFEPTPVATLREALFAQNVGTLQRPVLVIFHPQADQGVLVETLDAARRAGAPSISTIENLVN